MEANEMGVIHPRLHTIILKMQELDSKYPADFEEKTVKIRAKFSEEIKAKNLIELSPDKYFAWQLCFKNLLVEN